jgi:hypothetical protein
MPALTEHESLDKTERMAAAVSICMLTLLLTLVVFPNILLCITHYRLEKSHLPLTLAQLYLKNDDGEGDPTEIHIHGKETRSHHVRKHVYREHLDTLKEAKKEPSGQSVLSGASDSWKQSVAASSRAQAGLDVIEEASADGDGTEAAEAGQSVADSRGLGSRSGSIVSAGASISDLKSSVTSQTSAAQISIHKDEDIYDY